MPETDPGRRILLPTRTRARQEPAVLLLLLGSPRSGLCTPPAHTLPTPHRQERMLGKYFIAAIPVDGTLGAEGWNGGSQHLLEQGDGLIHLPELRLCLLQLGVQKRYVVTPYPRSLNTQRAEEPRVMRWVRMTRKSGQQASKSLFL